MSALAPSSLAWVGACTEYRRARVFGVAREREGTREEGEKELPRSSRLARFLPLTRARTPPTRASFTPVQATSSLADEIFP